MPACSLYRGKGSRGAPELPRGLAEELPRVWHACYYHAHANLYTGPYDALEHIVWKLKCSVSSAHEMKKLGGAHTGYVLGRGECRQVVDSDCTHNSEEYADTEHSEDAELFAERVVQPVQLRER